MTPSPLRGEGVSGTAKPVPEAGEGLPADPSPAPAGHPLPQGERGRVYLAWLAPLAPWALAASDAALIALAFVGCYLARFEWQLLPPAAPPPPFGPYLHASLLVAGVWTACLAWVGLYRARRAPSRFDDLVLLVTGLALGAGGTLALSFFYRSFSYSRLVAAYALAASLVVLAGWHLGLRALQARALAAGIGARRTLVLGANPHAVAIATRLHDRPRLGHQVLGHLPMPGETPGEPGPVPLLPPGDPVAAARASGCDEVLIAWPDAAPGQLAALVRQLGEALPGVGLRIAPDLAGLVTARVEAHHLDGMPLLAIREVPLRRPHNRAIKRAMDVAFSAAGLVLAAPLLAAVAIAVRLDGPGPVLYAQERLGRDGRPFTIYKFRTMPLGSEPAGPVWAQRGDDRATRVGAWLRRTSLDELPQLWNVLKGDMSLVGPRPERPFFVDQFRATVPKYMDRHLVRCGLTGWAQVNGLRGDVSIEARTRYDIWYVENWSVLLDLRIILETVSEIFRRPAY